MSSSMADKQTSYSRVYPDSVVEFAVMIGVLDVSSLEFPPFCIEQKKHFDQKQPTSSRLSKYFSSNYKGCDTNCKVSTAIHNSERTLTTCNCSDSEKSLPPVLQDIFAKATPKKVPLPNIKSEDGASVPNTCPLPYQPPYPILNINRSGCSDKRQVSCSPLPNHFCSQVRMDPSFQFQQQQRHPCNSVSSEKNMLPVLQKLFASADSPSMNDFRIPLQDSYPTSPGFPQQFCTPPASRSVCECTRLCSNCGSSLFPRPLQSFYANIFADDQYQLNLAIARGDMPAAHAIRSRMIVRAMNASPNSVRLSKS